MATKEFELGSMNGLPQVQVTIEDSGLVPVPVVKTRSTTIKAIVSINQPDDVGEEVWNVVRDCVITAAAGAAIAGILPGCQVVALPICMQVFSTCVASKGLKLASNQVQLCTETTYGEWS